ncbi:MAG: hypothetical protein ATN36_05125 [Epulopiscium sp. Nele67-Bin005]|nr:MAG: hypothetical protein ATN36_05125 [Epulopiscium sp. Nele67-Bin005]
MKKWDIVIIIILLILSFSPHIVFYSIMQRDYDILYANISVDGKFVEKYYLTGNNKIYESTISTPVGENIIVVDNQKIYIKEATCKDHLCVHAKPIEKVGQSIICLPHRLQIEIKGLEQNSDIDIKTY